MPSGLLHVCTVCGTRMHSRANERAFTLLELIVVVAIVAAVAGMSIAKMTSVHAQMRASHDARVFASKLSVWRSEATRLRQNISISFTDSAGSNPGTFGADIDNDGNLDDVIELSRFTEWQTDGAAGAPADITITGLGLISNLPPTGTEIEFTNRDQETTITVYPTGVASFVREG